MARALIGVDRVLTLGKDAKLGDTFALSLALDDERFDLIVDLSANFRSRFIAAIVSATSKVTYSKSRLIRERIVRSKRRDLRAPHTVDSYNMALRKIDSNFPLSAKRPLIDEAFYQGAEYAIPERVRQWFTDGESNGESVVVIAPGARHETKRAPLELFKACCEKLLLDSPVKIVSVIQSPTADLSLAGELSSEKFIEIVDAPLEALAFLLRNSQATLSNDSAVAHLSSAVGTPVVALFGPTHSSLGFSPRGIYDCVVENDEHCRPCSLHGSNGCSRDERYCFTGLSVNEISTALLRAVGLKENLSPALFLDRDGVIIKEKEFLSDPAQVEFYDNAFENLRQAQELGYKLVIVTNQSGVARGLMNLGDVQRVNDRVVAGLLENGIEIAGVYVAAGHPSGVIEGFRTPDNGRKPSEEMFVAASVSHRIDLRRSWVIGDRATDYLSALTIGARGGALVETGYGKEAKGRLAANSLLRPQIIASDLAGAISAIIEEDF